MPWNIKDKIARRTDFVALAAAGGVGFAALCCRFEISRKTGYKWLARFRESGEAALCDRRAAAQRKGNQTAAGIERRVVRLRRQHPTWGPRKLHRRLLDLGACQLPSPSILRREGCIHPADTLAHQRVVRFSRAEPNELWQMDFKGHIALHGPGRCHPLTVLDDCARYLLGLRACGDEQGGTVRARLQRIFACYGLPAAILCNNSAPWGGHGEYTTLTVWLLRLGVRVIHGRPHHPPDQGQGRALPPHAESGPARPPRLARPRASPAPLRRLPPSLQPCAAPRGPRSRRARQPLPTQCAQLARHPARRSSIISNASITALGCTPALASKVPQSLNPT